MATVINADEKFKEVILALPNGYTDEEFVDKFKELFTKDWDKIVRKYNEHERQAAKQKKKTHPMPNPQKYILNISHKIRNIQ